MWEIVFWVLVSIFSSIGVVQIVSYLEQFLLKNTSPTPVILILQKDKSEDLEIKIRYLISQINFKSDIAVVDMGISEDFKKECENITSKTGIKFIDKKDVLTYLEN